MPTAELLPESGTTVLELTAEHCRYLAAAYSPLAALLESEYAGACRERNSRQGRGASGVLPLILADQAAQQRNESAEQAMIAYYQLAHIHLQSDLLARSDEELRQIEKTVAALRQAKVPVEMDSTELARRRSRLNHWNTQLRFAESRLSARILQLVGEDPLSPRKIKTRCRIAPRPSPYALPQALEIAQSNDRQLMSIHRLLYSGEVEDLDVVRQLLQTAIPFAGQTPRSSSRWGKLGRAFGRQRPSQRELQWQNQQLIQLRDVRLQQLDLQVANAVTSVQERYLGVGISKEVWESWNRRVAMLESGREVQKSTYFEVVEARGQRLQAEMELLKQLIELEIEHVKLELLLGTLVQSCTDTAPHDCLHP